MASAGGIGRPRLSVEQLRDQSFGNNPASSSGRASPGSSRGHSIPGHPRDYCIPGPSVAPASSRSRSVPPGDRPRSPPCQDHVAEPPSAQTPQEPKVSSLNKLLGTTTLKESSITATSSPYPQAVAHGTIEVSPPSRRRPSLGSPILLRDPPYWYFTFYIRTDLWGSFHTYPDLGGPFQSLQEADNAIDRHLHDLRDPKMCKDSLDKLSLMESAILQGLYWPDGTRRSKPPAIDKSRDDMRLLVQALVHQYNEDHNLLGDLAYELKDVLHHQFFYSESHRYYHFNFTTETKGVDGAIDNLFFAEVKFIQGKHKEMVVSCFCIVKPNDNGHCYGCKNSGRVDMKHPNKADAYSGGHVEGYFPFGGCHIERSNFGEDLVTEEKRLRRIYQGLDDRETYYPYSVTPHAGVED